MNLRWPRIFALIVLCALVVRPLWAAPADDDDDPEQTKAEIAIGRDVSKSLEKHFHVVSSGPAVERLRRILKKLVAFSGRTKLPYSVKIIDSPQVNAVTCPGGFIYVFHGLLDEKLDDNMMACILGHEVTHAARSHAYRTMLQAQALGVITGGQGGLVSGLTEIIMMRGVGRTYENQADKVGLHMAASAGYDPRGLLKVMTVLQKQDHDNPGLLSGMVRTHPPFAERIKKISAELKAMGK